LNTQNDDALVNLEKPFKRCSCIALGQTEMQEMQFDLLKDATEKQRSAQIVK